MPIAIVSQGKVLAEYGNRLDQAPLYLYLYAGDQRIAMRDGAGKLHFYLNDHLGSARVVIDSAGTVKDKYKYLAYGGADAGQTVATNQPNRYTGKPMDAEAGLNLYYYGARYYDPALGIFTQIDPLRNKYPSWGPYAYCLGNPIRFLDANGDSARAANDQYRAYTATYIEMARVGDLGEEIQQQMSIIDGLDADVEIGGGLVGTATDNTLGETGWDAMNLENDEVTLWHVTIDFQDINNGGRDVLATFVHELCHVELTDIFFKETGTSAKTKLEQEEKDRQEQSEFLSGRIARSGAQTAKGVPSKRVQYRKKVDARRSDRNWEKYDVEN